MNLKLLLLMRVDRLMDQDFFPPLLRDFSHLTRILTVSQGRKHKAGVLQG